MKRDREGDCRRVAEIAIVFMPILSVQCTTEIREEDFAAHAANILARLNLMIWTAARYCTQVEPGAQMVSLRCTLV
jgi:hypothetical protein